MQERTRVLREGCFVDSVIHVDVKDYYGKTLKKTSDLKSNACLAPSQPIPAFILKALKKIHPEVTAKRAIAEHNTLWCLFTLEVDRKYVDHHTQEFGYEKPNVDFVQGYIEALKEAGLKEDSFDIIISNCVVNLSPDKRKVLSDAYRVLKHGGELYFSDVYSSSKLSDEIKNHKVLWGECLGGALWWEDLVRLAQEVGFSPPRLVTANVITVDNMELEAVLGDYKFVSATYRLFKIPKISNKGSLVIYNGNITGFEESLEFDAQYTFKVDEVVEVDGEVASILSHSRFAEEFTFQPPGVPAGCSVKKPKVGTVNPFELVLQLGSATVSSATGGCCGAESSCCK
ncbi:arsenite methyltransferase [Salvelinus sp. IW2-2015]|uniref:arsenite methyltransferase n=1 Tax=Salvelinus sp. IW2-2015 TaxID=2691554 RepID=UPI0038D4C0B4